MAKEWAKDLIVSLAALLGLAIAGPFLSTLLPGFFGWKLFTVSGVDMTLGNIAGVWLGIWLGRMAAQKWVK